MPRAVGNLVQLPSPRRPATRLLRTRPPEKASMNIRSVASSPPSRVRKCIGMLTGWMGSPIERPSAMCSTDRMIGRPRPVARTE